MFTRVRAQNFRCFSDLEFNLTDRHGDPKHFIMIYGENGAGKSNIAAIFYALTELLRTMDVSDIYQALLEAPSSPRDPAFFEALRARVRDVQAIVRDYSMAEAEGNLKLTFDFRLEGKNGCYSVELNSNGIVHERLDFVLEKNKINYFDIGLEQGVVRERVFKNGEFYHDIVSLLKKYWGKHTLLSIIYHEIQARSVKYILDGISDNFLLVLRFFHMISGSVKLGGSAQRIFQTPMEGFFPLDEGLRPAATQKKDLARASKLVMAFLGKINSDIKAAYYKVSPAGEDQVHYQLFLKKLICGKVRSISFDQESTGNQQMLGFLENLIYAAGGGIEILDEMDSGVHDIAAQKILVDLVPTLSGQLIITTHNTMLMECDFAKEATYVLREDSNANRFLECVTESSERIYQKTNIRNKYLGGTYDGIPRVGKLDFEQMLHS